jgi:hypothetical protein
MTDSVGASSSATSLWAGEGYSAFITATATKGSLSINFLNSDATAKYSYTASRDFLLNPDQPTMSDSFWGALQNMNVTQTELFMTEVLAGLIFFAVIGAFFAQSFEVDRRRRRREKKSLLIKYENLESVFNRFVNSPKETIASDLSELQQTNACDKQKGRSHKFPLMFGKQNHITNHTVSSQRSPQFYNGAKKKGLIALPESSYFSD